MDIKPKKSGRRRAAGATEGIEAAANGSEGTSDTESSDETTSSQEREVTFRTASADWAERAVVVGDFNDWSTEATPMERHGDHFELTMLLPAGREYRYRVLLDGHHWDNDPEADAYVSNDYGSEDSVRRS